MNVLFGLVRSVSLAAAGGGADSRKRFVDALRGSAELLEERSVKEKSVPRASSARHDRFSLMTTLVLVRMQQEESKYATMVEFTKAIGVSESTYWLLRKRASNLTIGTLERIAAGLNMSVFELIGNIDRDTLRRRTAMVGIDVDAMERSIEKIEQGTSELERFVSPGNSGSRKAGASAGGKGRNRVVAGSSK